MNEKPGGEQGQFFRDGQAQSAQKKDQEESGIDEFIGVVAEEDDYIRQGSSCSSLNQPQTSGGLGASGDFVEGSGGSPFEGRGSISAFNALICSPRSRAIVRSFRLFPQPVENPITIPAIREIKIKR